MAYIADFSFATFIQRLENVLRMITGFKDRKCVCTIIVRETCSCFLIAQLSFLTKKLTSNELLRGRSHIK